MHKKDDLCTIMIFTKKEAPVKVVHLYGNFLVAMLTVLVFFLLGSTYFIYDYISIRRDKAELYSLRALTKEQKDQFDALSHKMASVNDKMDELKALDQKIRSIANIDKADATKAVLGVGGPISPNNKLRALLEGGDQVLVDEMNRSMDKLSQGADGQKESFAQLLDFLKKQKSILAATPSMWPVRGWLTSTFGSRKSPFTGKPEFHAGLDIAAEVGTRVRCPADGVVREAGKQDYLGNTVVIEHGYGMKTMYGHLQKISVKVGRQIKKGEIVGLIGSTGLRSTGSHLHYGVYVNGVAVNPMRYVR